VLFKQAPGDHSTHGAYRQDIVEGLFSAMLNARLFELSQQADPPFLGGSGGKGRLIGAKEVFSLGASVREGGVVRGLDALLTEAERVAQFGFTTNELERATTRRLRGLERSFAERAKTDSRVHASEYIRAFLQHEPIPGIERELALHREYLPTITLDEVNRLARAWITPHNRVVVVSAPEKDSVPVPTPEELGAVFERVRGKAITAYTDTLRAGSRVATPPAPGRVVSESAIRARVTEWTLSNGIQVVLKPTDFKADEVLVQAISPGAPPRGRRTAPLGVVRDRDRRHVRRGRVQRGGPAKGHRGQGGPRQSFDRHLRGRRVRQRVAQRPRHVVRAAIPVSDEPAPRQRGGRGHAHAARDVRPESERQS
jgi:zinc protease